MIKESILRQNSRRRGLFAKSTLTKSILLVIRKDLMDIRKTSNKLAKYWACIPIHSVRVGVKVALKHQPINFEDWEIYGSKLAKRNGEFYLSRNRQKKG